MTFQFKKEKKSCTKLGLVRMEDASLSQSRVLLKAFYEKSIQISFITHPDFDIITLYKFFSYVHIFISVFNLIDLKLQSWYIIFITSNIFWYVSICIHIIYVLLIYCPL